VHSTDGWKDLLEPVIARYRRKEKRRHFRGDAFANPEAYEVLEAKSHDTRSGSRPTPVIQVRTAFIR
jgi:hypothetical protein